VGAGVNDIICNAVRVVSGQELALVLLVKPGSKREGFALSEDNQLLLRVRAQAKEGEANERVIEILAKTLRCPKRDLCVARGELSRHKEIRIKKLSKEQVVDVLIKALGDVLL
jgi:uncharacterized protein (TIGR00251 family)